LQRLKGQIAIDRQQLSRIYISFYSKGCPVEKIWEEKGELVIVPSCDTQNSIPGPLEGVKVREQILVKALVEITNIPNVEDYWQ
jgi:hypothetical protein